LTNLFINVGNAHKSQFPESFDLNVPFENTETNGFIDFMNIVRIYVMDTKNTAGRLVYTGFISAYRPYIHGAENGIEVTCLGMISLLSFAYYKNGTDFNVDVYQTDPTQIMRNIITHFNAIYPNNLLGFNSSTAINMGSLITYHFEEDLWIDALKNAFNNGVSGWWWTIDKEGLLTVKPKPTTATHKFTIGKDVQSIDVDKTCEEVINKARVTYPPNKFEDFSDATSIAKFGTREEIRSDERVVDQATAIAQVTKSVNDNKVEKIKTRLTINSNYDIESIQVGDTCQILNMSSNQTVFTNNMLIVAVHYSFNECDIELEEQTKFSQELQKFIS